MLPSLICFRNTDSTTASGRQSQKGRRKTTEGWAYLRLHSARQGEHLWALGTLLASRNCFLSSAQRKGAEPFYFLFISLRFSSSFSYSSQKQKMASPPDSCYDDICPGRPKAIETVLPEQVTASTFTPPPSVSAPPLLGTISLWGWFSRILYPVPTINWIFFWSLLICS